jgi:hypothetical protein
MTSSGIATLDPAPPAPSDGGGGGRWAWLVTAGGIVEAELIHGILEQAGVPVVLDRRDPSPFAWMYLAGNVNAPIQIYVPASLLDEARLQILEAGVSAPEPSTPSAQAPVGGSRRLLRAILTLAAVLVAIWIVLVTYLGSATCALRLVC